MEDLAADFIIENNQPLELDAEISEPEHFDCVFELYAAGTTWGSISGTLSNQTDLQAALDLKADKSEVESVTGALADSIQAVDNKYDSITSGLDDSITAIDNKYDSITGALDDKIDNINGALSDDIDALESITSGLSDSISAIDNTINNYGDIVNYNAADFATSAQGALADTALQPNDNISELVNDVGYITSASLPTVNNSSIVFQKNGTNFDTITLNQPNNDIVNITVPTTAADVNALPDTTTINDLTTSTQQEALNSGANTTNIGQIATNTQDISDEITNRQNADNGLQSQIDALVVASDVFDIVGTYAELQAYDISTVPVNDIIKVLVDSTHNDAATYYRCVETGGVKSWSYIGSEGAYYTKGEADAAFVPQTRTVNGYALSNNISLTASDVGALPDSTVIPTVNNSTITIQKNGATVDTFTLNQATAKTINITVPIDTSDLTNGAGFISGISYADVITALGFTPYNSTNPNGYITSSALNGYATETWVNNQGFMTGITSSDIITALSYTPYDASNPDGFITSADLANYLQKDVAQSTTGTITFVGQKKIEFKQSAAADKLGFTDYNASGTEIGAFEYRPNTISGKALLNVNCPYTGDYVGFRYWGTAVNIIAPKVATAGDYYIPTHITDGNTTVTASNTGSVNISSLLPTVPTTDQTYDGTSANPQSGVAIEGELANYVKNTHTGSGLTSYIDYVSDEPTMQYENSSYIYSVSAAYDTACLYAKDKGNNNHFVAGVTPTNFALSSNGGNVFISIVNSKLVVNGDTIATVSDIPTDFTGADSITAGASGLVPAPSAGDEDKILTGGGTWESANTVIGYTPADNTLSNVSSIDNGSAVKSALDDKVNKSGDTMTGGLAVEDNIYIKYAGNKYFVVQNTSANYTNTTAPSSSVSIGGFLVQDVNGNTFGGSTLAHDTSNNIVNRLYARRSINGTEYTSILYVGVNASGATFAIAPNPQTYANDTQIATTSFVRHVVQSGEVSISANSEATVTFPYTFPDANVNIVVGRRAGATTTGGLYPCYVRGNPTASSFKVYNPTQGSQTVPWIAVYKG